MLRLYSVPRCARAHAGSGHAWRRARSLGVRAELWAGCDARTSGGVADGICSQCDARTDFMESPSETMPEFHEATVYRTRLLTGPVSWDELSLLGSGVLTRPGEVRHRLSNLII